MSEAAPEPAPDIKPPEPAPRRYPSTVGGLLYLVALGGVFAGLGVVALDDWRTGVRVIAVSLAFAACCRLVLPSRQAGMLAVRHRAFDVPLLLVVAGLIWFLAGDIPQQPF